jgi:hypothetical protein
MDGKKEREKDSNKTKSYPRQAIAEISVPNVKDYYKLSDIIRISNTIYAVNHDVESLESVRFPTQSASQIIDSPIPTVEEAEKKYPLKQRSLMEMVEPNLLFYETLVKTYEQLINKQNVKEPEIQNFLEKNPIIINREARKVISKKSFGGEKFPDFIVILHNGIHILVEIETPQKQIFTRNGHPTSEFSQAEQQVRDYLQWANEDKEFLRKRGLPGICVENTRGLLIIGMRQNLNADQKLKLSQLNYLSRSSHEIKTFDDLLMENATLIDIIRRVTL